MLARLDETYLKLTAPREEGQGLMEYGLILMLVVIVVVAALAAFGPQVVTLYNKAGNSIPS